VSEMKEMKAEPGVALWNPDAATKWSLLFTPAFGAYLHALNWRAMGERKRARASMNWFYVGLSVLAFNLSLGFFVSNDSVARLAALVYILSWYFSSARVQAKHVKQRYGVSYTRRSWGKPLLIAMGGVAGFFALAVLAGFALAILIASS